MCQGKILCVDDESNVLTVLKRTLEAEGFEVFIASSGKAALTVLEKKNCDIALIDYKMPEMNGIELVKRIKENGCDIESIMVTAYGDVSLIVKAIKEGAHDYIIKPFNDELLVSTIRKVLEYKKLLHENRNLKNQLRRRYAFENLVGSSPVMKGIFSIIDKVKDSSNTVLIHGESGTGKEQIAKAIHYSGNRKNELFIPVDCTSINPNIIESELFGHVRGAFTGAHQAKEGLLKSAGRGTIFLDEIAEIPPNIQVKHLRALQEMVIKPVGSTKMEKIEARVLAATNKNIYEAIEKGEFREDLFYRLNVVSIEVPPLREHKKDIPRLVDHFIEKYNTDEREIKGITQKAIEALMGYRWPGNIRQLENCIERAFVLGTGEYIDVVDLPQEILLQKSEGTVELGALDAIEKEHIIKTILQVKGNKLKAAEALGIRRSTLYSKIKKYNIHL
ncbi:sigma-54-dependent transcriptional regulator [candidate division KSB1 bacterium]